MTAPPVAEPQDVCASDPNFAIIFAFCEQFGDSCGVTIPTFQELQEMLEKTNEVPDALVDLHIKLLRRVKKSVHADKWERAILKFCQVYNIPEFWELERYGYKGISVQLKLRILKTLFEAQFDSNVKFKGEINKLTSSTLRSQPLGWDKSGTAYWVQFDRACNIRVYKEDIDEDTWKIVAKDRNTLLSLINELSGSKDNTLDDVDDSNSIGTSSDAEVELSPDLDQEKHSPSSLNAALMIENNKSEPNGFKSESEKSKFDSKKDCLEKSINLKKKLIKDPDEENLHNEINDPIVGEAIEESVMFVKGEGSGEECDTGNPDEINTQNDTSKIEDTKKPKLWSIETICSSSKEVQEEIISVPKTGFFFGDDSVPCFNNVSNGESSHPVEDKSKQEDEIDCISITHPVETFSKESSPKNQEEFTAKNSTQSVFNIKVHEEEVQITERNANEVFIKSESSIKHDSHKTSNVNSSISVETLDKIQEPTLNNVTQVFDKSEESQLHSSNESIKYDTEQPNIGQIKIVKPKVSNVNDKLEDHSCEKQPVMYDVPVDKQVREQEKLNMKTKENETEKLDIDPKLIPEINNQTLKVDNNILINKQLTSKTNLDEVGIVDGEQEKINEFFANTEIQCVDIIDQSKDDVLKKNSSTLNETKSSNLVDSDIIVCNQILPNDNCNIISDKKTIVNSTVENNEKDKQVSEKLSDIPTTDDLKINATCSNDNEKKTEVSNLHVINNFNQCLKISKQIDTTLSNKKSKKTSHNISNIIKTDLVVSSDSTKEQSVLNVVDEIKLDKCQVKNQINTIDNILHEDNKSDLNVNCQKMSNIDIHLDEALQKSDLNVEISESLKSEKKSIDELEVKDKPGSSKFEIDMNKTNTDNSEINIKEITMKNIDILSDSTKLKIDSELTEDKTNIAQAIPIIHESKKEILNKVDEVPIINEDKRSISQSNKTIKLNKSKKEKPKLLSIEDKTDSCYTEMSKSEVKSQFIIDEESVTDISQDVVENITSTSLKREKKEVDKDNDTTNKKIEIEKKKKEYTQDQEEDIKISSKMQTVTSSPVQEHKYESADETNNEALIGSPKKQFEDSSMVDHNIIEDNQNIEEKEVDIKPKTKGRPGRKKGSVGKAKRTQIVKEESKSNQNEKVKTPYKPRQKKVTVAEEVTVIPEPASEDNVRRSRRIAEIKIKEQFVPTTLYDDIDVPLKSSKKKDKSGKKGSTPTKKMANVEESDDDDEEDSISKKFKKRKRKGKSDSQKKLNKKNPWNVDSGSSSSENNIELFEDYDHEEEDETPRPGIEPYVSDHEFSPESDINEDDDEYLPEKRARTAHKKDQDEPLKDDMSCQKCNKSDQPEWILLCDTCNQGWHASCLRPALMVIPDGDWYCPHCRHEALLNALRDTLKKYDGESKKRENEELRRKRLAYVGISLQNVISSKSEELKTDKQVVEESSENDESESESESYDSEPLYQLRARRQTNVSYRYNDYDDMINEAILEEAGIDESSVKKPTEVKTDKNDNDEQTDSDSDKNDKDDSPIAPALLHLRGRKKSKKLTNLDISSDDGSDEDFKGPSDGDDDYEEDVSEYSDDSVQRRPQPTRRSVRNRKTVVDPDFINDDSSEESDKQSKKKRSRPWSESSNSEEDDSTWGRKKKKRSSLPSSSSMFKLPKDSKRKRSNNDSILKPNKSKIKYGMDSDSDDQPKRKTRGRQITYAESDDSEEEIQTKKRKVMSDDEDEYVLNDEELEAEKEEVDDEESVANNEEKDDEEEEEDDDSVEENEEQKKEETKIRDLKSETILDKPEPVIIKSLPSNVHSVIKETQSMLSSRPTVVNCVQEPNHIVNQRLLPPSTIETTSQAIKQETSDMLVGTPEKRKRQPYQMKKALSPNLPVDFGGSGSYPHPPDATKVVSTSPSIHSVYNRLPSQGGLPPTSTETTVGFKPIIVTQPPGGFPIPPPVPYRTVNKIASSTVTVPVPPAYLPAQVQQVYQAPPPPNNYSPFPINYSAASVPLPPPPPAIAFRNVAPSPQEPTLQTQQPAGVTSGDSEFGGLVSYFSSQQEDDFDT